MSEASVKRFPSHASFDANIIEQSISFEELSKFLQQSGHLQNLYSSLEGSYSRRILKYENEKTLEIFIRNTMYSSTSSIIGTSLEPFRSSNIRKILDEIICQSKKFCMKEVHFNAVWVYCYCYHEHALKGQPVFKIYKKPTGEEATFLSVDLKIHNSWNDYIEHSNFPPSLLCFPRNGKYNSINNQLDLEYVVSKNFGREVCSKTLCCPFENYQSFSQAVIQPSCDVLKESGIVKKVIRLARYILAFCKEHKSIIFKVVVVAIQIYSSWSLSPGYSFGYLARNIIFMLLNVNTGLDQNVVNILSGPSATKTGLLVGSNNEIIKEVNRFIELVRQTPKNWIELLDSFSILFRKARQKLETILNSIRIPFISYLFSIIELGIPAAKFVLENEILGILISPETHNPALNSMLHDIPKTLSEEKGQQDEDVVEVSESEGETFYLIPKGTIPRVVDFLRSHSPATKFTLKETKQDGISYQVFGSSEEKQAIAHLFFPSKETAVVKLSQTSS